MPSEQLPLIDVPAVPRLTARQARALEHVQTAGPAGIHADELGAMMHAEKGKHGVDDRCQWCGATGQELLLALRAKGLVKYRRGQFARVWYVVDGQTRPAGMLDDGEALPF